jgi:hypothetical protein
MSDRARLRFQYVKHDRLAFLGHLEVITTIQRCVRRANLPFAVGNGFARRMKIQFSQALPVGASSSCEYFDLTMDERIEPAVALEPGRSIVADAGLTLYTVQSVKRIPGYKNYVAVDGGMTDNPRLALYKSRYTVLPADNMNASRTLLCDLAGCCCESGDLLQQNVALPETIRRGDLVAVCTTGAYNYAMASNYNRVPRPPVVMLRDGDSYVAVRRESLDDLTDLDA